VFCLIILSSECQILILCFSGNTLEGVRTEKWWHNGLYEVIAYAVIEDPLEPTVFHCELRIPEAQYEIRKNFIYYPGEYNQHTDNFYLSLCCGRKGVFRGEENNGP
jgi:hypothetical protein